ncbi:pseudouridylate synthase TRUB2, mitochondrial-like [Uloborus diversus]|uniref:pseudouridylate synthase TRUB2, mitochondrial-like n=1 Tax=Uloborus diversus TaxID=327109 RepID=UPI0024094C70|nr:pseudouridylate synthase TRUB2, mitochondrial-like [Uloborus diversus]
MPQTLSFAPDAWKLLNGIFCVYKPPGVFSIHVRNTLAFNLCRDLNEMKKRPPNNRVLLKGSVCSEQPLAVEIRPNYADHELVSGPRYQMQDIRMRWLYCLGKNTSGVFAMTVNDGCKSLSTLSSSNFLRKYEVKGQFGKATTTFMSDGKVMQRTTYYHIRHSALDRVLASIQSSHQSLAYEYAGVNIQSQEAYEMASKGVIRPSGKSNPIIYSIKCTDFSLPNFTLEIQCINENETFLAELVHQIGVYLRSTAFCTQLRQLQFGQFTLDHALLRKHWTLENILSNVTLCKELLDGGNMTPNSAHFESVKTSKSENIVERMQNEMREDAL